MKKLRTVFCNWKRLAGVTTLALVGSGFIATGLASAESLEREKQFDDYLARAIQIWSGEADISAPAMSSPNGQFFSSPSAGAIKVQKTKDKNKSDDKSDDDSSSDDKSSDSSSMDDKSDDQSSDDQSSDDQSSDDQSSDDQSSDDQSSDDQSSEDKPASCLPDLQVTFMVDLLTVEIMSDKKLKRVTLLFHDGSTQEVQKLKGKQGVFAGLGDKEGEMLTGVWVSSGCNESEVDESMPCPVEEDDDSSSDEDSSSDDNSNDRKRFKKALKSGDCDDGDLSCLEAWTSDDDSSSDDHSDDDSSQDHGSDDDSSNDHVRKCGEFFPNDMTPTELPAASIADAEAFEGSNINDLATRDFTLDPREVELEFVVTLSSPVPEGQVAEVGFRTVMGTAIPCEDFDLNTLKCASDAGADFIAASGILLFEAGSMSQSIIIYTIPDDIPESDEGFTVELVSPSENLRLGDDVADGLIKTDDDLDA